MVMNVDSFPLGKLVDNVATGSVLIGAMNEDTSPGSRSLVVNSKWHLIIDGERLGD